MPRAGRRPRCRQHLRRRYRAERRFRALGLGAIGIALTALVILLVSITARGWSAFVSTELRLDVPLDASLVSLPEGADAAAREQAIDAADWGAPLREALLRLFPEVTERSQVRELAALVSTGARSAASRPRGARSIPAGHQRSRSGFRRTTRSTWS